MPPTESHSKFPKLLISSVKGPEERLRDINRAMSGRCSSCAKSFGLFNKEHGCFKCGFSFCGKCCAEKKIVGESRKRKVCGACFEALSKPQSSTASNSQTGGLNAVLPPPENLLKREQQILDKLPTHFTAAAFNHVPSDGVPDSSAANSSTGHNQMSKKKELGHDWSIGLGPEDLLIKQRLQKLKEEPINKPKVADKNAASTDSAFEDTNAPTPSSAPDSAPASTDDRLVARVNALKGIEASTGTSNQSHLPSSKKLNQQDQVDELLQEIADEVEIDSRLPDPAHDVENRLRKLRGEPESGGAKISDREEMASMIDDALNWKPKAKTNGGEAFEGRKGEGAKGDNEKDNDLTAMEKIMAEMAREMEYDAKKDLEGLSKDDTVRQRLEELKEFNKKQNENDNYADQNDEDEAETQKVIQRLVDEAKLEDHDPNIGSSPSIDLKTPLQSLGRQVQRIENNLEGDQQLPWCVICNEDATLACPECDGDLFCSRCFRECHRHETHEPKQFQSDMKAAL